MKELFNHINSRINITENEFAPVVQRLKELNFSKNEIILRPNQLSVFHFFVRKGCLRSFFIDDSGKEHTISFAIENWFIGDYVSYFFNETSRLFIECLEDSSLLKIEKHIWEDLYSEIPQLETYTRINLELSFAVNQKKTIGNLSLNSKERYSIFRTTYPNIEQRVKNYHIASYLGITPETLSRVRSEY